MLDDDDSETPFKWADKKDNADWWVIPSLLVAAAAAVVFWLVLTFGPSEAAAHEATNVAGQPTGWTYGYECCSAMDCKPAGDKGISEIPEGYRVNQTGEIVAYADRRVKRSKDEFFHWCAHQAGLDAGKTICIYVPDRGF